MHPKYPPHRKFGPRLPTTVVPAARPSACQLQTNRSPHYQTAPSHLLSRRDVLAKGHTRPTVRPCPHTPEASKEHHARYTCPDSEQAQNPRLKQTHLPSTSYFLRQIRDCRTDVSPRPVPPSWSPPRDRPQSLCPLQSRTPVATTL